MLTESDFVDFWCVYLVSLAHEHFVKEPKFSDLLSDCRKEIEVFKRACQAARIPEIHARKSLREVLEWALDAVGRRFNPKVSVKFPTQDEFTIDLFGGSTAAPTPASEAPRDNLPGYASDVRLALENVLLKADLGLWLMIDRLDEVFPRRSETETKALRGLLRTLQIFSSSRIRVKIFLRDDILTQVASGPEGFTGLTHITARQADRIWWSEEQIITLVMRRLAASDALRAYLQIDQNRLAVSPAYQQEVFYRVFSPTVHSPPNQSATHRWIYTHTKDGRDVVTPRDVIDLLTRAKQRQQDEFQADPAGTSDWIIGPTAILYGHSELSRRKRDTYLRAEFPHFWPNIEKFAKGKTEYSEDSVRKLLGRKSDAILSDLVSIGFLVESNASGTRSFKIPFLYREGLELTQGRAD